MEGRLTKKLSLTLILVTNAQSMSNDNPPDEIIMIGLKYNPTNKPLAPNNSKTEVRILNFARPKRSNSALILLELINTIP